MPYNVEIKTSEAQPLAVVKFTAGVAEMGDKIGAAFGEVMQYLMQTGAQIAGPAIGYYEQLGNERFNVSAGFLVAAPSTATAASCPSSYRQAKSPPRCTPAPTRPYRRPTLPSRSNQRPSARRSI